MTPSRFLLQRLSAPCKRASHAPAAFVALLVAGLLTTGFQHAFRLCPATGHLRARSPSTHETPARCERHGAPLDHRPSGGSSGCCSPLAALVAAMPEDSATLVESITGFAAMPALDRALASAPPRGTSSPPAGTGQGTGTLAPRLRTHLTLRVILV